jgi:hypothetical protein
MAVVGTAIVDFIAETARFNADIKRAAANLNGESAKMNRALAGISANLAAVKRAGQAIAGAAMLTEFASATKRALDYAGGLGEVAQQLGVTTDDLQVYQYAATQVGVTQSEMERGLQRLSRTLGEAQTGSASAGAAFAALGVQIRTADGGFRSVSDILPEVADAIAKIPDPARRAAVEAQLFGKAGQQLAPLLEGGRRAIDKMRTAAYQLGGVLSSDQIANADRAADKLAEVKYVMSVRFASVVADNTDAIYDFANSLETGAREAIKFVQAVEDVLAGGDRIKKDKGYFAFLFTDVEEQRRIGATDRTMRNIMGRTPEGVNFGARPPSPSGEDSYDVMPPVGAGGRGRRGASSAVSDADRMLKTLADAETLARQTLEIDRVRLAGLGYEADLLQTIRDTEREFAGLDAARLAPLLAVRKAILDQKLAADELATAFARINMIALPAPDIDKLESDLDQVVKANRIAALGAQTAWADAAHNILYSLEDTARGIQGGDFLQTLRGVTEMLIALGSIGVFGKQVSTNIGANRGYAAGGYTGNIGTGAVAGLVHGQEYVFDAAATRRIGVDTLERIRRGAGFADGGYTGGAIRRIAGSLEPATKVQVVPGAMFDVIVEGHARRVAVPIGVRAAQAGADAAGERSVRRSRNRIPSRA